MEPSKNVSIQASAGRCLSVSADAHHRHHQHHRHHLRREQLDIHQKMRDAKKTKKKKKRGKHKQRITKKANNRNTAKNKKEQKHRQTTCKSNTHATLLPQKKEEAAMEPNRYVVLLRCRCCAFSECFVFGLRLLLVFVVRHGVCVCKCLFVRLCHALLLCGACVSSLGSWDSGNVLRAQP